MDPQSVHLPMYYIMYIGICGKLGRLPHGHCGHVLGVFGQVVEA